jgi:hypothetical protein
MILFQRIEQLINIVKALGDQFVLAMRSPAPPGA